MGRFLRMTDFLFTLCRGLVPNNSRLSICLSLRLKRQTAWMAFYTKLPFYGKLKFTCQLVINFFCIFDFSQVSRNFEFITHFIQTNLLTASLGEIWLSHGPQNISVESGFHIKPYSSPSQPNIWTIDNFRVH